MQELLRSQTRHTSLRNAMLSMFIGTTPAHTCCSATFSFDGTILSWVSKLQSLSSLHYSQRFNLYGAIDSNARTFIFGVTPVSIYMPHMYILEITLIYHKTHLSLRIIGVINLLHSWGYCLSFPLELRDTCWMYPLSILFNKESYYMRRSNNGPLRKSQKSNQCGLY